MQEMTARNKKKNTAPIDGAASNAREITDFKSELNEACWSVISFERVEATGLTYTEAAELLGELSRQGLSGLCIVTVEVAERISEI